MVGKHREQLLVLRHSSLLLHERVVDVVDVLVVLAAEGIYPKSVSLGSPLHHLRYVANLLLVSRTAAKIPLQHTSTHSHHKGTLAEVIPHLVRVLVVFLVPLVLEHHDGLLEPRQLHLPTVLACLGEKVASLVKLCLLRLGKVLIVRKSLYPNRWHEGEEHTVVQTAFRVVVELMHTAWSTAVEAVEEDRNADVARQMALALLTAHGIVECLAQKVVVIAVHRLLRLRESCHLLRELNGMFSFEIVEILQHLTCGDVVAEELHSRTWIVGLL